LSLQIDELEGILDEKYKKEKIERDLKYEEYLKSDEYQEMVKNRKNTIRK
jgi:hypothetical protein